MDPSRFLRQALSFVAVQGGTSMKVVTVGLDLAKHIFQFHGADTEGRPLLRRRLRINPVSAHLNEEDVWNEFGYWVLHLNAESKMRANVEYEQKQNPNEYEVYL